MCERDRGQGFLLSPELVQLPHICRRQFFHLHQSLKGETPDTDMATAENGSKEEVNCEQKWDRVQLLGHLPEVYCAPDVVLRLLFSHVRTYVYGRRATAKAGSEENGTCEAKSCTSKLVYI